VDIVSSRSRKLLEGSNDLLERLAERSKSHFVRARCVEVDGWAPLMLDHVDHQLSLRVFVWGLQRTKGFSPSLLLGMSYFAGLVVARNPYSTAGMICRTVVMLDPMSNSCPEVFEG
jgi:hypothetical protein